MGKNDLVLTSTSAETMATTRESALDDEDDSILMSDKDFVDNGASNTHEEGISIAKDETKAVSFFRVLLMVFLVSLAIAVSLTAYFLALKTEEQEFKAAFHSQANKVVDSFRIQGEKKASAIVSMAVALTSHAQHGNLTWPFVTLPDFEVRANLVLDLAEVFSLLVLPVVTQENLGRWGQYSMQNQGWFKEGVAIQQEQNEEHAFNESLYDELSLQVKPVIIQRKGDKYRPANTSQPGPFLPVWQYSPPIPVPIINFDLLTEEMTKPELQFFLRNGTRGNLFGPAFEHTMEKGGGSVSTNAFLERSKNTDMSYERGPLSYFYTPVFKKIGDSTSPLVGIVKALIFWQTSFDSLLPDAKGITVVLENDCNQAFTFELVGEDVSFIGEGDLHDPAYDDLQVSGDYGAGAGLGPDSLPGSQLDPHDTAGCCYHIQVYPSKNMEDDFMTKIPLAIALSMFGIFLATAMIFIAYDQFVEKRQKLVLETAVQSSSVVSNLFPETVRDRLYGKNKLRVKEFLEAAPPNFDSMEEEGDPIADEYLDCTVLFADLVGFTSWSSTKTPSEVFFLLETLYGAFDRLAHDKQVFKVETIGDCYVAVTGLPKPQKNHAVIMAKFASGILNKMDDVIHSKALVQKLGESTSKLTMRVGLNSGPVTAGILRGSKARFQLFGDTVNTAARMEALGKAGRIHASQTTADLIIAYGKSNWLTPRADLVEAKGKGMLQCYWVHGSNAVATSNGDSVSTFETGDAGCCEVAFLSEAVASPPPDMHEKEEESALAGREHFSGEDLC